MQYFHGRILPRWSLFNMALMLCAASAFAASGEHAVSPEAPENSDTPSKWFLVFGAANVQPRLEPSELQINQQINGVFGKVLPRWERPRTFRDWRDEFRLWDFHVGFGRELSPRWVWMSTFGGTLGTVRNEDRYYPLGVPAMFHVDFSRKLWFASTGLLYYPWGQSVYEESTGRWDRVKRSLKGTRPFVGGVVGYIDLSVEAVVKIDLPLTSFDPRIVQKQHVEPFYVSPRVGVDIPLTKSNDLVLASGYLFFNKNNEDLDNWSHYVLFKHRFKSSRND